MLVFTTVLIIERKGDIINTLPVDRLMLPMSGVIHCKSIGLIVKYQPINHK